MEAGRDSSTTNLGTTKDFGKKREAGDEGLPWFLHTAANPPNDPLTIGLLTLVEDLPSIPGPKTVGPENYSRILRAFMKRGWAGFEEEFDSIVPRERPDYAEVKRDLLCEPLFSLKVHRNMVDAVLGSRTVDEIFDEMTQQREQAEPSMSRPSMKRICPNPERWAEAFGRLIEHAKANRWTSPPRALVLGGWVGSNDVQKMKRWAETIAWAQHHGCADLVSDIPDSDFYFADDPTSYAVGPMGGPLNRNWDFEVKSHPPAEQLAEHMDTLLSRWAEIVGQDLSGVTRPIAFTGERARRLLVLADGAVIPPWGGWSCLSPREPERRTFTCFRAAINRAIAPHEVDHIDFTVE